MTTDTRSSESPLVFRKTDGHVGRHVAISPGNSAMRHLSYARIILKDSIKNASIPAGDREMGLIVLSGSATLRVDGESFELSKFDCAYIPRDSAIEITTAGSVDIAEFSAEVAERHAVQIARYADVTKDATLHFKTGSPAGQRQVSVVLGKNIEAGRLLAGFTISDPGNWTSWPPHEHAEMLEEIYVFFDMPAPAYGVQFVYNDTNYPEFITAVREGDAVIIPRGYHPNVAIPGHPICFLWALAAHRENDDRKYGVVNVQPDFQPK
jgi:5-deoxy-glucuronate isomerase